MSTKLTVAFGLFLGAASLGIIAPAEASLIGRVSINPEVNGGVILEGIGLTAPNSQNPLTNIDFTPPENGGVGGVIEINAPTDSDFRPFIGWTGNFKDLVFPAGVCTECEKTGAVIPNLPPNTPFNPSGNPTPPVLEFARIDDVGFGSDVPGSGGFVFDLLSFGNPVYTEASTPEGTTTTISISAFAQARKLDENGNITNDLPSLGTGNLSADFAGLTADEVRALFDEPGEIPLDTNGNPIEFPYSSEWVFAKPNVPESSNTVGLIALGFAGATMAFAKKRKQNL